MILSSLSSLAPVAGQRIVAAILDGTVVTLIACSLMRVLPRTNAGTRFMIWFASLLAVASTIFVRGAQNPASISTGVSYFTISSRWALYGLIAWLAVAAYGLARVAASLVHLRSLRKSGREVEAGRLDAERSEVLASVHGVRRAKLCVSDKVRVPTAIGFVRPMVLIPSWALEELSAAELKVVVRHELGHLRRWDDWTNLVQKI